MTAAPQGDVARSAGARERSGRSSRRRRNVMLTRRDKIVLGVMVGVPTLIQLVFIWIPTLLSVGLSFVRWNGLAFSDIRPAALSNYDYVFNHYPPFWPALEHNVLWLVFLGLIATPLGLLLAVLLDQPLRGSRIYQSIFFVPVMLSLALIAIIWQLFYNQNSGLLNYLLGTAGHSNAVDWLGDSNVNIWAALVAATWRHSGYVMVLYLAGLKGVDPSLREAASIDGANARQAFFRVVFPVMRP
ncbi:MAG TPA: sugar ABC transporter permease, partial [Galbitalea sp.]